eukprot:1742140-Pyramimonas_sp.AAC.1
MGFLALSAVVGIVAFGLEARVHSANSPLMATAVNHEFVRKVGALNQSSQCVLNVSGGYNCRGFTWIGPARTETVFDTGATRNSID